MTPQNQRTIGWLVVIVGIIALATTQVAQPERQQR